MNSIHSFKIFVLVILTGILVFFIPSFNLHSQIQNQKCLSCHGKTNFNLKIKDGSIKLLYVNDSLVKNSPHKSLKCNDCHTDIEEFISIGHKKPVKEVQCTRCHFENNSMNIPESGKYKEFRESVHSKEKLNGNKKIPNCQTCHGSHEIPKRSSMSILELKQKIGQMCGQCHFEIFTVYRSSIHGVALYQKNISEVPVCTDCHGEHTIKKTDDPTSSVNKSNIPGTCGTCHANEKIVEKYGIKADKYQTYETSFHGIAGQFGEKTVANCSSCHGAHDIKPQIDPTSSINSNNLIRTCGKCHQDANINYVKGIIHVNVNSKDSGSIFYINLFFKWLTSLSIILFVLHVILSQYRRLKYRSKK